MSQGGFSILTSPNLAQNFVQQSLLVKTHRKRIVAHYDAGVMSVIIILMHVAGQVLLVLRCLVIRCHLLGSAVPVRSTTVPDAHA